MVIQDVEKNGSGAVTSLTRYGLGGRGIDVVSTTTSSGNTVSYPLYDAHGNNVGLLGKNGSSFTVSNEKSYDAWGGLRTGSNANGGKAAYCANLGHKQDDESGLIYMRARYYELTSGRFVSEDIKRSGINWYVYCSNNPVNKVDASGYMDAWVSLMGNLGFVTGCIAAGLAIDGNLAAAVFMARVSLACFTILFLGDNFLHDTNFTVSQKGGFGATKLLFTGLSLGSTMTIPGWMNGWMQVAADNLKKTGSTHARMAVYVYFVHCLAICGALLAMDVE
jgi:RHS repeat-associated protein